MKYGAARDRRLNEPELGHLPKSGSNEQASGTMKICHGSLDHLEPALEVEG